MESTTHVKGSLILHILGQLHPDNRLDLMPSYISTNSRNSQEDPESSLVAVLYDEQTIALLRYHISASPYCVIGQPNSTLAVRAKIPFPEATRTVRFYLGDILLHEIEVSEGKPEVEITWPLRDFVEGKQIITWTGKHPEERPLQYFLRYTYNNGVTWQRTGWRTNETSQEVDFRQLPGGEQCRIAVVATDGVNTTIVESASFVVAVKSCIAMILEPGDGDNFAEGQPMPLRGQGFYLEENEAETEALAWSSSKDGEIGQGMYLEVSNLSAGQHQIRLIAGTGDRAGETTVAIRIGRKIEHESSV